MSFGTILVICFLGVGLMILADITFWAFTQLFGIIDRYLHR